jgi:hypothetical protein
MRVWMRVVVATSVMATAALGGASDADATGPITSLSSCGGGYYQNSDGQCIPDESSGLPPGGAPGLVGSGAPPAGATAVCRDGDYSFSTHHTGTCSGHGGVRQWLAS